MSKIFTRHKHTKINKNPNNNKNIFKLCLKQTSVSGLLAGSEGCLETTGGSSAGVSFESVVEAEAESEAGGSLRTVTSSLPG